MVYGLGGKKVNLVQGSGEDWATIHRQAGGGAQVSSLWHAENPCAQFIPTYSTARSVASCGTSCVLSDWAHNLSHTLAFDSVSVRCAARAHHSPREPAAPGAAPGHTKTPALLPTRTQTG